MLNAQDCLYHVNLQGLDKGQVVNSLTMIDVISRALNPYTQNEEFMKLADQPEMRFVISNTTEAGIAFDPHLQTRRRSRFFLPRQTDSAALSSLQNFQRRHEQRSHHLPLRVDFPQRTQTQRDYLSVH